MRVCSIWLSFSSLVSELDHSKRISVRRVWLRPSAAVRSSFSFLAISHAIRAYRPPALCARARPVRPGQCLVREPGGRASGHTGTRRWRRRATVAWPERGLASGRKMMRGAATAERRRAPRQRARCLPVRRADQGRAVPVPAPAKAGGRAGGRRTAVWDSLHTLTKILFGGFSFLVVVSLQRAMRMCSVQKQQRHRCTPRSFEKCRRERVKREKERERERRQKLIFSLPPASSSPQTARTRSLQRCACKGKAQGIEALRSAGAWRVSLQRAAGR